MASEDFQVNDLVWAKMKGCPPWPARITEPLPNVKPPKNKAHFVYLFAANNFVWVLDENIIPHSESMLNLHNKKSALYRRGVDELLHFFKSRQRNSAKNEEVKVVQKKRYGSKKGKVFIPKKENKQEESLRKYENCVKKCQVKIHRVIKEELGEGTSPKRKHSDDLLVSSTPPLLNSSENSVSSLLDSHVEHYGFMQAKQVSPTVKIGFIGLGNIGRAVVHNLLKSGHDVFIWNKTPYKCREFLNIGARKAHSPADLIVACHITFCCVSDANASKAIIYGNRGILEGLEQAQNLNKMGKGYVEMTSIDPETSRMIDDVISKKGGKYLEAPICENNEQGITILAAGSRNLFVDCKTCFDAMAKHAYFISCDVGFGSKMGFLFRMLSGTLYAAGAEVLKLAALLGLEEDNFLTLLDACAAVQTQNLIEKCRKMMNSDFKTVTPLKHIQKNLNLTLILANKFSHSMPLIAAANEVYKHARHLEYSNLDVSAVYQVLHH